MAGESPTKWQAQAYRFGVRRLESAVASGDPLLRGDPARRRLNIAFIISFVLAALILGVYAIIGVVSPEPSIGDSQVVVDEDTGGVYVHRDGRLYPAMNYSSALLAAARGSNGRSAPSVTTVNSAAVGRQPRGPLLGIAGAPNILPSASHLVDPKWTVCDTTSVDPALPPGSTPRVATTAILGEDHPTRGSLGDVGGMLVSADGGRTTYLLWGGRRSRIDLADNTVRLAFDLAAGVTPRPISAALLDVIPAGDDITPPSVDRAVEARYAADLGVQVGDVFGLQRADRSTAVYVALADGIQPVTPLVGDLIRDRISSERAVPLVAPKLVRVAPHTKHPIDLQKFPETAPQVLGYQRFPVACAYRSGTSTASTDVLALGSVPVPKGARTVTVTKPGDVVVDDVYVDPGEGAVLCVATQSQPGGARALYVVTDEGVAYPVVSGAALVALGYQPADVRYSAPQLLNLLPKGPALDPDEAVHFYPQTGASAAALPAPPSPGNGASPAG